MKKNIDRLMDKAYRAIEEVLDSTQSSPSLKLKAAQDLLDRGGPPKRSAAYTKTAHLALTGKDLKEEREHLLAEWDDVNKQLKELDGNNERE